MAACDSGAVGADAGEYKARTGSLKWQAIEDVLLAMVERENYSECGQGLCVRLGYKAYYENKLGKKNSKIPASEFAYNGILMEWYNADRKLLSAYKIYGNNVDKIVFDRKIG